MRGRNYPDLYRNDLVSSHPFDFALLKHTQEPNLRLGRQFTDFVQKKGATVCSLEATTLLGDCSGEGAFFVAKQLAVDNL